MSGPTQRPGGAAPGGTSGSGAPAAMPPRRPGGGPGMMFGNQLPVQKAKSFRTSFGRLLRELEPERTGIIAVLVLAVVSVVLAILGPKILGEATNVIFEGAIGNQLGQAGLTGVPTDQIVAGLRASGQENLAQMLGAMGNVVAGVGIDFGRLAQILGIAAGVYLLSSVFSWGQTYIMAGGTPRAGYPPPPPGARKPGPPPPAYL